MAGSVVLCGLWWKAGCGHMESVWCVCKCVVLNVNTSELEETFWILSCGAGLMVWECCARPHLECRSAPLLPTMVVCWSRFHSLILLIYPVSPTNTGC